jgi:Pyruvate/2-oxoacid:ferredoxin oxidoreductase gamma subunit
VDQWKDAIAKRVPAHTTDANLDAFDRGRAAAQAKLEG